MAPFLWALLTALTWGFVPIIEKIGLARISPMIGLFYRCLGVVVGIVLLLAIENKAIRQSFSALHPGMLFLIGGGFLASVVGQIFFYMGLKNGESSQVVPLAASYPLVTFILAAILLGEKVTISKIAGLVFIVLGIFFLK